MEGEESPLTAHLVVLRMEEITDKLKILNCEKEFCQKLKFRPFPRHYFAIPTNSGEQFHSFTNLAVWLLKQCGSSQIEQPQEFDDPNATIATIITEAKKLGVATNFPPMKLKTGSGEQVCYILDQLTDKALERIHFNWQRPVYPEDTGQEETLMDSSTSRPEEVMLSKMEEEIQEDVDESDDEGGGAIFLDLGMMERDNLQESPSKQVLDDALESTVDPEEWRQEVERVLPSLKVKFRSDNRDWRLHYEQMHSYHDNIKTVLSDTRGHLDKLHAEISKTLEKISSREKYINQQLETQVLSFRSAQDRLAATRNEYKQGSYSVNELSQKLAEISAKLESVKAEMDEKGTSMTDAGPVVRIKQALTKLKEESTEMDVQIGLLEHTLLELQYKTKTALRLQMSGKDGGKFRQTKTLF